MPKQVIQIKKYSGGLNSYSDPRDLKEDEFQVLDNAAVDEEGIIRVSGALELKDNIDLSDDEVTSSLAKSGKGLFSHRTDYVGSYLTSDGYIFNSNLEKAGDNESQAWGLVAAADDATWKFEFKRGKQS